MKVFWSLFFLLLIASTELTAQDVAVNIQVKLNGETLKLQKEYSFSKKQYRFDEFKFYVGKFKFLNNGKVQSTSDQYFLVDLNNTKSLSFVLKMPEGRTFNEVQFVFGVDSALNDGGVQGGSLDPASGMYWAWQSGYVNFRMEGLVLDELKKEQNFQFHLGGFLGANKSAQNVRLKTSQTDLVDIVLNLDSFLANLDLNKNCRLMSPGSEAVYLMTILKNCFYLN
jgi:hypothetical protein